MWACEFVFMLVDFKVVVLFWLFLIIRYHVGCSIAAVENYQGHTIVFRRGNICLDNTFQDSLIKLVTTAHLIFVIQDVSTALSPSPSACLSVAGAVGRPAAVGQAERGDVERATRAVDGRAEHTVQSVGQQRAGRQTQRVADGHHVTCRERFPVCVGQDRGRSGKNQITGTTRTQHTYLQCWLNINTN